MFQFSWVLLIDESDYRLLSAYSRPTRQLTLTLTLTLTLNLIFIYLFIYLIIEAKQSNTLPLIHP